MYQQYNGFNQQIIKVNGENGANAFSLPPNSSALLLDSTNPRVYLVQTDGAGYKTITAYKIEPYVPEPQPDIMDILARLKKLEESYGKSGFTNDSSSKRNQSNFEKSK